MSTIVKRKPQGVGAMQDFDSFADRHDMGVLVLDLGRAQHNCGIAVGEPRWLSGFERPLFRFELGDLCHFASEVPGHRLLAIARKVQPDLGSIGQGSRGDLWPVDAHMH